ncbi:MAG TPA: pseudouridine synthase [Oscillospiraceae bacterium]|nr:pseudouridine synthase [Oscillospiraceae bacterium]HPS74968.1 pseudouridine synthase [Oscillospiraceae bacterium]
MKERIQKLLSARGVASRRTAEKMIEAGRVTVNGVPAVLGESADPDTDDIRADGAPLPSAPPKTYIMLNKPKGYVTTLSDEKGRKDVSQLVAEVGERLYPVGRLDLNSEGLLLMTNDGDMANRLMHPSHNIRKTYHTWVRGGELDEAVRMLQGPMVLDGEAVRGASVTVLSREDGGALLAVTIGEGKNRQVRRMCEQAGLTVTRLKRVKEGPIELGTLPPGKWRRLSGEELQKLLKSCGIE